MTNKSLTAAAVRYSKPLAGQKNGKASKAASSGQAWQSAAWDYYGDTPEVRFAAVWIGNSMGRARLFAGRREDDGSISELPADHTASRLVAQIGGGPVGQTQLLTEFGPHLVVPGEGWLVVEPSEDGTQDWHLVSTEEMSRRGATLTASILGRAVEITGDDDDPLAPIAVRVWQPHPRRHEEADSPIRSSTVLLEELRLLNAAVAAIAKSRLTGRGILAVPQGMTFPSSTEEDGQFLDYLMDTAETAYGQPDSAAAAVPVVIEVPADSIDAFRHLTFASEFDDLAVKLREETIRRFASGLDTPAEILLGSGGLNHWSQWAIDEGAIRLAVEPRLALICDAITNQFIRPALQAAFEPDAADVVVWYDASGIRHRAQASSTAIEAYRLGAIGISTLRSELGYSDADAPNEAEQLEQRLWQIVLQAPSLAPTILPMLGVSLPSPALVADVSATEDDGGPIPEPGPVELPVGEDIGPPAEGPSEPAPGLSASDAVVGVADEIVFRALERAGNKLRAKQPRSERATLQQLAAPVVHCSVECDETLVDGLLAEAWVRVPEVAVRHGLDADDLQATLDSYTRRCLIEGQEHTYSALAAALGDLRGPVR